MKMLFYVVFLLVINNAYADVDAQKWHWPKVENFPEQLYCVRERTLYTNGKHIEELSHKDLYHLNFDKSVWNDFKYKGKMEYLGSGEFSAKFVLRDSGGFPYKIVNLVYVHDKGLYVTRAEVVGDSVFSYWSKCSEVK